jgi:nondiscriminating aspartyl-tRNA synthetase
MKRVLIKDAKIGERTKISGYVNEFRNLGKIKFIDIRDSSGSVQIVYRGDIDLNREDVIEAYGVFKKSNIAKKGLEFEADKIEVISKVRKKLPVDPLEKTPSEIDTRLQYRFLDLRRKSISEIFIKKSKIINAYRNFLLSNSFIEIHPSLIIGAASEGGAEVFEVQYFEKKAYLAQSPQLYKQMAVIGGLEKVFITLPIYRAEKHNTIYHLNEAISLDIEMGFIEDYNDVMDILENVVKEMLKSIDIEPPTIKRYTYKQIVDMLNENGYKMDIGQDFTKEAEKKIYEILKEEIYFITDFPTKIRAFYTHPKDDTFSYSFDLFYKGLEIASGAQRIHDVDMLEKSLIDRGLNPIDFEFYLEAFRYGVPKHGGFGMGLERFLMQALNLSNIREATLFPRDRTRIIP